MKSNGDPEALAAERFGERARQALALFDRRGLPTPSQGWLARRASQLSGENISQPTVGKWLAGKAVPDTALRAWAFAAALGVDPGWLVFNGTSSAAAPPEIAAQEGAETTTPPQSEAARDDDAAARREAEAARVAGAIRFTDQQHAGKQRRREKGGA